MQKLRAVHKKSLADIDTAKFTTDFGPSARQKDITKSKNSTVAGIAILTNQATWSP